MHLLYLWCNSQYFCNSKKVIIQLLHHYHCIIASLKKNITHHLKLSLFQSYDYYLTKQLLKMQTKSVALRLKFIVNMNLHTSVKYIPQAKVKP